MSGKIKSYINILQIRLVFVVLFLVGGVIPSFAQVSLEIPTDDIFTAINSWIVTFAPIVAIGIGISASIVILGYVGSMIVSAFKSRGR